MCLTTKTTDFALLTICDSIAINILDKDTVLRGVGNELHLHRTAEATKVLDVRLKGKIHGIERDFDCNEQKIIVFGEKEFVLLERRQEHNFHELYRAKLSDWISSAKFLKDGDGFVLLTAHSVLLHFGYYYGEVEKCKIIDRISCSDKSTLYCAHISGASMEDLIVFGGNAFGELLIWQPNQNNVENGKRIAPLSRRMNAHNGVIFSIDYEPREKLLITTSDDRSISFWSFLFKNGCIDEDIQPIANGFGHQARVFQGKFIQIEKTTFAVTVGEDSHFCLWNCNGKLFYKKRIQFGAVIWNLAFDKSTCTLCTVGSTGNMISYNLKDLLENKLNNIPKKLATPDGNLNGTEYIAKIKFLTRSMVIGWTSRNRLLINNLEDDTWRDIGIFTDSKCTVLEVFGNLVAICGYKRFALLEYCNGTLHKTYDEEVLNGVIRSFHFLSETHYLISDEIGNCVMLKKCRLQEPCHIELPKCKERWLTAALLINERLMLVSNRLGNIMLYEIDTDLNTYQLRHILKHPHGHLGATSLQLIELKENFAYVQSAGHDSTLKTLSIDCKNLNIIIDNFQTVPVAWIDASVKIDETDVFLGFNDNHFIAWTEEHDITLQVACGGGHRCWHFYIYNDESMKRRLKLMFIKNKNVLLYEFSLFNRILEGIKVYDRNRWHTKPCNALEIVKCLDDQDLVIISAGDDNLIKISSITCDAADHAVIKQQAEVHTHISNIRALKVLHVNANKYVIFSGGGRAQLCLTSIDAENNFRATNLLSYTLRSSSKDSQTSKGHSFDPETRIMSIDVQTFDTNAYNVFLACSDGYLRKLHIDHNMKVHLDKEVYYGKCLLQVRLVADSFVISTATDGVLSIFSLDFSTVYMKLPLQASGINALDINYQPKDRKMHILSGGDDQSVSYALICLKSLNEPELIEKLHLPQLHTAQVTAAKFSYCGRYLFTSGVDQNLVKFDLKQREIVQITHSCVADVKGLALDDDNKFYLIYGCGLQIFKLSR